MVLWRFAAGEQEELRASRIAAVLLFALAAAVAITSAVTLLGRNEPTPTRFGIAILIVAALCMPWLAKQQRSLARCDWQHRSQSGRR